MEFFTYRLPNGIRGIHVYTVNKPDVAARLRDNLSEVLGR